MWVCLKCSWKAGEIVQSARKIIQGGDRLIICNVDTVKNDVCIIIHTSTIFYIVLGCELPWNALSPHPASTGFPQHWQGLVHGSQQRGWRLRLLLVNCWTDSPLILQWTFLPCLAGLWWMWRGKAEICPSQQMGTRPTPGWWWSCWTTSGSGRRWARLRARGCFGVTSQGSCSSSCVSALRRDHFAPSSVYLMSFNRSVKKSHVEFRFL